MVQIAKNKNGAPERTRTSNRQNRNLSLYPLSYGRTRKVIVVHEPSKIKNSPVSQF